MKASNANKVISVLLSVAMCPMMVPSAAFAADDDAASGASSPTEQAQSADQAEGTDTGASSSDTIAPQSEATDASTGEAAPAAAANEEGAEAAPSEESTEAAVAEVNGKSYPSLQAAIDAAARKATVKLLADTKENVTISTPYVTLDLNGHTLNGSTGERKPALTVTNRVYVMDSSAAQAGTIMREDTAETQVFLPTTSSTFRAAIAAGCSSRAVTSRTIAAQAERRARPLFVLATTASPACRA